MYGKVLSVWNVVGICKRELKPPNGFQVFMEQELFLSLVSAGWFQEQCWPLSVYIV